MTPIVHSWWTNRRAAEARFALALNESDADKVFNDDWAKRVAESIDRQRKTLVALILASVVPTGYLALSLMDVEAKVSQEHTIPPWTGAAALAAGVVLIVVGVRKS